MIIIGVTGNIGSGKSTVCRILTNLGATTIDADKLAHEAYRPNSQTWQEIVTAFGKHILKPDAEIDREKLGQLVFSDPASLARLNQIVHPEAYRMVQKRIEDYRRQGATAIALEAILLIEAGWVNLVDTVWLVVASEDVVIQRLTEHKGDSKSRILSRLRSQVPSEEKIEYADELIYNDGDLNQLETRITELWQKLPAN
jgi:dephospho-CoA kinase